MRRVDQCKIVSDLGDSGTPSASTVLNGAGNWVSPGAPISGTAFPGSPATNDLFFRTDRGLLYYYDGSRWLTVSEYSMTVPPYTSFPPWSATTNTHLCAPPSYALGSKVYYTRAITQFNVQTTNNGTHYWTISINANAISLVNHTTFLNSSWAAGQWHWYHAPINTEVTMPSDEVNEPAYVTASVTKSNSPGEIYFPSPTLFFRLVG